jgi:hypothetical protein
VANAFQTMSEQLDLSTIGHKLIVPIAGYNSFSCEYIGDAGSAVVEVKRQVITQEGEWSFSTAINLASATPNHFNIDVSGVGAIVFVVTTAASGKVIKINTLAARY